MKKWFALCAGAVVLQAACFLPMKAAPSPMELLFEHALTLHDTAAFRRAVADTIILHSGGDSGTVTRRELWELAQPILNAFPDIVFRVEDEVISGNKIAARVTFRGTHQRPWNNIQPTGRGVVVGEMFICTVRKNRLVECWQEWDEYGLRRQLAAPEAP